MAPSDNRADKTHGPRIPATFKAAPYPSRRELESVKEVNKLIVGRNIRLKGEILDCDTLVVEGTVEARMESESIEVAEGGIFSGEATVDSAEVHGLIDGTLTVRDKLLIHSGGKVIGTIRYGDIEIKRGGNISGDIEVFAEDDAPVAGGLQDANYAPAASDVSENDETIAKEAALDDTASDAAAPSDEPEEASAGSSDEPRQGEATA